MFNYDYGFISLFSFVSFYLMYPKALSLGKQILRIIVLLTSVPFVTVECLVAVTIHSDRLCFGAYIV